MNQTTTFQTTLGDLIVALSEETSRYFRNEKEAYRVVAFMLTHLLNNSSAASRTWQYWH